MREILTERLIIRPISKNDFNDIREYGCDEEIGQYMLNWPKSKEQLEAFIDDCILAMNSEKPNRYEFVMQLKSIQKTIGNITLEIKDNTAVIGWISNKEHWNKGYMSEAVKKIIEFAFQYLPSVDRIIATCTEKNVASYRVMEKCGMKRIGRDENLKSVKGGTEVSYTKLTYCINRF